MLNYALDLTPYTWTLTRPRPDRVRLMLHFAPVRGNAAELAQRFRNMGVVGFRVHSRGSIFADNPSVIVEVARALGATPLVQEALEGWAGTWVGRSGVRLPTAVHKARKRFADQALEYVGSQA